MSRSAATLRREQAIRLGTKPAARQGLHLQLAQGGRVLAPLRNRGLRNA